MKKKYSILIIIAVLACSLWSEENLTLESMVNTALQKSLAIEAELLQYRNTVSSKRKSLYNWLPTTEIDVDKTRYNSEWQDISSGLSANWGISSNDTRYFEMRRQMIAMAEAEFSLEEVKKTIAYNVLSRYLDVLEAQDMVALQKDLLSEEEKKYEKLKVQNEIGEASIIDFQQAEIDKIQAEINLINMELSLSDRREELFYYCGCQDQDQALDEVKIQIKEIAPSFKANLQYLIQEKNLEQQKFTKTQSYLNLFPYLSLNLNHSRSSEDGITDFDEYSSNSQISLQASYSIFDVFSNYESWSTARRQYQYYQRKLLDLEQSNLKEYNNLNKTFDSQKKNLELYSRKTELAEQTLERAQVQYNQGSISLLDLNDYQNRLYTARKNQILERFRLIETQESINLLVSDKILGEW